MRYLTYGEVIDLWIENGEFRFFFVSLFKGFSIQTYRWETPPVNRDSLDRDFEFVIIEDPHIDLPADRSAFLPYFKIPDADGGIVSFGNLGKDAVLIVPIHPKNSSEYSHMGKFHRNGQIDQVLSLWHRVGVEMKNLVSNAPSWLNTAGGGVPWLHVRIDSRPKYYLHPEYRYQDE